MADAKTANIDLESLYRTKVLPAGIGASGKTKEIVDIITSYPWSAQTITSKQGTNGSVTFTHNLPYCYAIERQLTVGANITSVINTLLGNAGAMGESIKRSAGNTLGNLLEALGGLITTGKSNKSEGDKNNQKTEEQQQTPATKQEQEKKKAQGETPQPQPAGGAEGATGATPTTTTDTTTSGSGGQTGGETATGSRGGSQQTTEGSSGGGTKEQKSSDTTTPQGSSSSASAYKILTAQVENIAQALRDFGANVENTITRMGEGNLNSNPYLYPWRWLYFTKVTGKRFIFPTFSSNDILKMTSKWGDVKNPFSEITDIVEDWSYKLKVFADATDILPQSGGTSRYMGYKIEYAKGFMYDPENCQTIVSRFVLYNTIKKDAWKQNYRFIMMFLLRNLPLRTSIYAYQPPLLYDIIIPGVKHLPLCYVENIDVSAEGHVRNMQADNILKEIVSDVKNKVIQVPVPEAWKIEIKFKCLIPDTMNLILSTTTFPINVTTTEGGRDSYQSGTAEKTEEEKKEEKENKEKEDTTAKKES